MSQITQVVEFKIVDGKIAFDAQNFRGQGCGDAVKFLAELGQADIQHKPEYGQPPATQRNLGR